ncbi:MAG: hypothetical protein JNK04_06165 [Myxococcales bacterium]|nr:hypothetical protein [Myxococcales bacterium]
MKRPTTATLAALLVSCGTAAPPEPMPVDVPSAAPDASATPPHGARREISQEDCTAKGGSVVGDIGDGATHRPEFRCPSGSPPIGNVPLGVEGSVCCL